MKQAKSLQPLTRQTKCADQNADQKAELCSGKVCDTACVAACPVLSDNRSHTCIWMQHQAMLGVTAIDCMRSHMCARGNAIAPRQLVFVLQHTIAWPQPRCGNMSQHGDHKPADVCKIISYLPFRHLRFELVISASFTPDFRIWCMQHAANDDDEELEIESLTGF